MNGKCAVFIATFIAGFFNVHRARCHRLVKMKPPPALGRVPRTAQVFHRQNERVRWKSFCALIRKSLRDGHARAGTATCTCAGASTPKGRPGAGTSSRGFRTEQSAGHTAHARIAESQARGRLT